MVRFKDISIPKPCSVAYDSLPGNEVKRFCGSCEKHVYDFRGKDEIYFNSIIDTHGKVCGVFYEDEIKQSTTPIRKPFYHAIAAKFIGAVLFVKTLLHADQAQASPVVLHPVTQQATDSTSVEVILKNRPSEYSAYLMDIFINNKLFKSGANLDRGAGFIWLPDSLKENDKIRIVIKEYSAYNYKIRQKEYSFLFKDAEQMSIKIKFHKIVFCKRKRRVVAGYMLL